MTKLLSRVLVLVLFLVGIAATAHADMCRRTGNVEVSYEQSGTYPSLTFKFKNYNTYPVQVSATFHLVSTNGENVDASDVLYIPAGGEKSKTFQKSIFDDGNYFKNSRCGVTFYPESCDTGTGN